MTNSESDFIDSLHNKTRRHKNQRLVRARLFNGRHLLSGVITSYAESVCDVVCNRKIVIFFYLYVCCKSDGGRGT